LPTSSPVDLWPTLVADAGRESVLWEQALRPERERELTPVFSPLGQQRFALGLETIYEGYLVHYGRPRLFEPGDGDTALLLGDYLYAHGLVRIAEQENVEAVADLAELISLCAELRAGPRGEDDGVAWAATAALLGSGWLDDARTALREADPGPLTQLARAAAGDEAVENALAAHRRRVD
jgi:hypothetical protein